MSEEESGPIRPRSVPLRHIPTAPEPVIRKHSRPAAGWLVLIGILIVAVIAVFVIVPDLVKPDTRIRTVDAGEPAGQSTGRSLSPTGAAGTDSRPPPFAALMREQAREGAQTELARFVELQIALEQEMQVGAWGKAELDAAKSEATRGDELFVAEQFERALEAYGSAADMLAALIDEGRERVETALERGERALDDRRQQDAEAEFNTALSIDPENTRALEGLRRARLLPRIVDMLRKGKNQELSGQWEDALDSYAAVRALDPATKGIEEAMAGARAGASESQVRTLLSRAFSEMEAGRYEAARSAFRQALVIKPGDPVALGGLEQVAERADLTKIDRMQQDAQRAEAAEDWQEALNQYDAILALDANLQFAKDGRNRVLAQQRLQLALGNIIASPDKLSSSTLFTDAQNLLARAERLTPRGPKLAEQIDRVAELIRIYATPVPVIVLSDNQTQVTLSTIGSIGTFTRKELSLRPGAYTVIGSRNGYRDVRASILVRPSMPPVDVRCSEAI
ncbi:MAG: hypothetical protein R3E82_04530 [Pseudomonadales bacterium]|nr:hypothetical protein [Pseudomonadales bacterium]